MRVFVAKHFGALRPVDPVGEDAIAKIKHGEIVAVDLIRPRNGKFHRLFMGGLLALIYENTDGRFKSIDHLLTVVKIGIGHADLITLKDGTERWHPRSISFAKMDEDSFRAFFNRAVDYIIANILPVDKPDLEREVYERVGIDWRIAA
jgi:hypothetical protein